MKFFRWLLFPFALIYSFVVFVRNRFFDWGWYQSYEVPLPAIVIGNLSAGGTGKTPHTEMLVRLLRKEYFVAILSRGYGRKTTGFILADDDLTSEDIGDEPLQYHEKFHDVMTAVDENRKRGITMLQHQIPHPDVILLDDAFQHRKIKAGLNILLTDFSRPFYQDLALPTGNLRDNKYEKRRADLIIVTKCPPFLSEASQQEMVEKIKPAERQQVFFSSIKYGEPVPLFSDSLTYDCEEAYAFTGIANPNSFLQHLEKNYKILHHHRFPDHHHFNKKDISQIKERFQSINSTSKCLVTTEKDAMRLLHHPNKDLLSGLPLFYIPIEVHLLNSVKSFEEQVLQFVSGFQAPKHNRH